MVISCEIYVDVSLMVSATTSHPNRRILNEKYNLETLRRKIYMEILSCFWYYKIDFIVLNTLNN